MIVKLLTKAQSLADMEGFAALATLTCHANTGNMNKEGYKPSDTLRNIIKAGHESILEHINLTFSIQGLSRACLHELERHRHVSMSVESTRYTLRGIFDTWETSDDVPDLPEGINDYDGDYGIYGNLRVFYLSILRELSLYEKVPNDELKYYLPEFWPTNLIITLNIREFRHILDLRTAPNALKEFRILARSMFYEVPEQFRYLLQDCIHEEVANG